jgi:hypothetical protein
MYLVRGYAKTPSSSWLEVISMVRTAQIAPCLAAHYL